MHFSLRKALIMRKVGGFKSLRDVGRWAFKRYAGATALITQEGSLTFTRLGERVYKLARTLNALGVKKGDSLFVLLADGQVQYEARLAAHEAGAVLTFLSLEAPLASVLAAAQLIKPKLVIYDPLRAAQTAAALSNAMPELPLLASGKDYEALLDAQPPKKSDVVVMPDDLAAMGFTSGTTGQPKLLTATHGTYLTSLKLTLQNVDVGVKRTARNVFLIGIPLTGAGSGIVIPALFGGATFLIPNKYEAGEFLELIARYQVTLLFTTPSLLIDMLDHPSLDQYDLKSLHTLIYGTELMPTAKLEEALRRFGPILQQGYGSAEVLPPVSMLQKAAHWHAGGPATREALSSVGTVVSGVTVIIGDASDQALPAETIGQVLIKSPTVFKGYWGHPELNEAILRGGYLHTNDVGYFDTQGRLHVLGRSVDLIRRNNHITYPRLVEEVIHDFPAVKEASLVQVGERAILVVSLRRAFRQNANNAAMAATLLAFLKDRVPAEDLPDEARIVDELPRSYLAKVLRREVRASLEMPTQAC